MYAWCVTLARRRARDPVRPVPRGRRVALWADAPAGAIGSSRSRSRSTSSTCSRSSSSRTRACGAAAARSCRDERAAAQSRPKPASARARKRSSTSLKPGARWAAWPAPGRTARSASSSRSSTSQTASNGRRGGRRETTSTGNAQRAQRLERDLGLATAPARRAAAPRRAARRRRQLGRRSDASRSDRAQELREERLRLARAARATARSHVRDIASTAGSPRATSSAGGSITVSERTAPGAARPRAGRHAAVGVADEVFARAELLGHERRVRPRSRRARPAGRARTRAGRARSSVQRAASARCAHQVAGPCRRSRGRARAAPLATIATKSALYPKASGFGCHKLCYARAREWSRRRSRTLSLAGAGSVLIGTTAAVIVIGILIGWLAGSAAPGASSSARSSGIPVGVFVDLQALPGTPS